MSTTNVSVLTGSVQLDRILGGPGLAPGSLLELFGDQGTGKTTLSLELINDVQENSGQAAFLDVEHSLDVDYAKRVGVRPDELLFSQPDTGEQALDICLKLVESDAVRLIVVDSAAALLPASERGNDYEEDTGHHQSGMLSGALRKLSPRLEQTGTVLLFTNQVRSRLNRTVGPDETTPGGNALKFYADVRMKLSDADRIKRANTVIGRRITVDVEKNRDAPPDQSIELDLLFDRGICPYGDLLDAGRRQGLIERNGGAFHYHEHTLGGNRRAVRDRLRKNPDLYKKLRNELDQMVNVDEVDHPDRGA